MRSPLNTHRSNVQMGTNQTSRPGALSSGRRGRGRGERYFGRSPANPAIPQSQVTENTHSFEVPLWRCRQAFHAMRIVVSARQQSSLPGGRLNRRRCNRRGRCRNTQIVRRARQHGSSLGRGPNRARWNRSSASPTMYVEPSRTTTRGRLCRKPSHFHM